MAPGASEFSGGRRDGLGQQDAAARVGACNDRVALERRQTVTVTRDHAARQPTEAELVRVEDTPGALACRPLRVAVTAQFTGRRSRGAVGTRAARRGCRGSRPRA